jgi:hypothetical protein
MDIEVTVQFILDQQAQMAERHNKLEQTILELGQIMLHVTNAQQHAGEILNTLAERQLDTEEALRRLAERQVTTQEALHRLAERQGTTEETLNVLLLTVERHISHH